MQAGDTIGSVTITASGGAATNAAIGTYTLTPSAATGGTFSAANYTITYNNGTLTVNPLGVTVTAAAQTKVYGAVDPALTYGYTPALVSGDTFSGALSRVAGESVGSYAINQGTVSLSTNYSLIYVGANLVITPAALGITANNTNKAYGQTVTFAGTEFTASGLQFSDSVTGVTLTSAGATNTAIVGSYSIVPSAATGTGLGNYTITYNNGTLTVNLAGTAVAISSSSNPSGYLTALTFTATVTPTNASGSVTFYNGATPFSTNSLVAGSASSSSLNSLPRGTNTLTAIYGGDSNYVSSTNSLAQVVTNHPPVAANVNYYRNAGISTLRITIADLLTNVTDVDLDTLTLTAVGTSTNGISSITNSTFVLYQNTNSVNDQFTYTVDDGNGGSVTANVNIVVQPFVTGQSATITVSGPTATVQFFGIPGYGYGVQRSTNLTSWATLVNTNAPANGAFEWTDDFSDLGVVPASAYYRLQYNP